MRTPQLMITIATLMILAFFSVRAVPTFSEEDTDITNLIQTADTPEDHMKMAEYYNEQAEQMNQMAQMHESMGEAYSKRSKPMTGMANHCAKLSKDSKESAAQYKAMAQEHEMMAHGMMNHDSQ
jgi:hypothetical protein